MYFRFAMYPSFPLEKYVLSSTENYSWYIDSITERYDVYEVSGWIVKKEEDINSHNIELIIVNEDGSSYRVPTEMQVRKDVTEALNNENQNFDYNYSGFSTVINRQYIQSSASKIYILYQNNGRYEIVDIGVTFQ